MRTALFLLCSFFFWAASAQIDFLQSGPMLGYNEMREVMLWAQTKTEATVQFTYWPTDTPSDKHFTIAYTTQRNEAYTAKLIADEVEPGVSYTYELLINNQPVKFKYPTTFTTQPLWQWRTDPPDFTVATGSCAYMNEPVYDRPGTPYGSDYRIFSTIHKQSPDVMLWLGDNTYLREVDWFSQTGIFKRYTHSRSIPELQPLLANTHHYAIWDDHDFGPNDSDRSYIHKDKTLFAFERFWGNPTFGVNRQPGITTAFQWADIDFFLLDNRYFRNPNDRESGEQTLLGKDQLEWLVDALTFSKAPFKMIAIGGQVLNTAVVYENYIRLAPEERAWLLGRIEEEGITGVVFLSGDRHHTELSQYTNARGIAVYDLTVSPLTSGVSSNKTEINELRVAGTHVFEHNFGLLRFSGKRGERQLHIRILNKEGVQLWEKVIQQPKTP
ncbi:MAG: alkaline phosphatase D family protein [Saprospiraceae bacterium]